jgi:HSP20 family protein
MSNLSIWNPFRRGTAPESLRPSAGWRPFRELEKMQRRMDELFRHLPAMSEAKEPLAAADWLPAVDITEDDQEYLVKAELPEVKKEDVKVTVEDGTLSITGERKSEKEEKGKKFHRVERSYGRFERTFALPDNADATKVTSNLKDGLLEVHLAKNPVAKPKATEVKIQ